jgi:two-component system response regulator NreC
MPKIQVLIVDDHTLLRKGVRSLLANAPDIEVIGEAADGREGLDQALLLKPQVALVAISMPKLNGIDATALIRQRVPGTQVIILTMHDTDDFIFQALRAGAAGYLLKDATPQELVAAIIAVANGHTFLSPAISRRVVDEFVRQGETAQPHDTYASLTLREREVLQLIAEGRSTREIAEELVISVKTVDTHRAHIIEKTGLRNTAKLTQFAIRKGLLRAR